MPTGYTADLYDGKDVSFEDFTMNCARAFGALVSLRDEPNAEIPDEFPVDEYYVRRFKETSEELEKAQKMTDKDFALEAEKHYSEEYKFLTEAIEEKLSIRKRYENMLEQVKEWNPPTKEHFELKKFMIDQLEESIRFDASTDYYEKTRSELTLETPEESKARILEDCEWRFNNAKEQLEKSEAAARERTEWIVELRRSLNK